MTDLHTEKVTAELDGEFVVFRIGMRINALWKVHRWLPILRAMPRMLAELENDPDSGLLAYDFAPGVRNQVMTQYWRSFEALREYALDPDGRHAPAISWTNERMNASDDVGIWHETYVVRDGEYETVYHNTPPIGLGKAGRVVPATGRRRTAAGRLGRPDCEEDGVDRNGDPDERIDGDGPENWE